MSYRRKHVACLLVAVLGMLPGVVHAQGCPSPPEYLHRAVLNDEGRIITLATARTTYLVGEPITFRLSYENNGSTDWVLPNPAMFDPADVIVLVEGACDSLPQAGCYDSYLYRYPFGVFFFGLPRTLQPGQCHALSVTWNGIPAQGGETSPGAYAAFAGRWAGGSVVVLPVGGIRLDLVISNAAAVPTERMTWGRLKLQYP